MGSTANWAESVQVLFSARSVLGGGDIDNSCSRLSRDSLTGKWTWEWRLILLQPFTECFLLFPSFSLTLHCQKQDKGPRGRVIHSNLAPGHAPTSATPQEFSGDPASWVHTSLVHKTR